MVSSGERTEPDGQGTESQELSGRDQDRHVAGQCSGRRTARITNAWKPFDLNLVSKQIYGDVGIAFVRPLNFLLLFVRTLPPGVKNYSRTGIYALIVDGQQIAKRVYYGNAPPNPPTRWANQEIRKYKKGRSS